MPDGGSSPIKRQIHPGSGRRKAPIAPKGRGTDPSALNAVQALLGDRPRRADLLIEFLHLIQDQQGHLPERMLAALAEEMSLPQAAIYETASFYAHFDIVMEDEEPPQAVTIRVCESLTCEMKGAQSLMADLAEELGDEVRVVAAPCMGRCDCAPVAEVGHRHVDHATPEKVTDIARGEDHAPEINDYVDFDAYVAEGGYNLLKACLAGEKTPEDIIQALTDSGIRGLGGAGFPTGMKWNLVRQQPAPRLMAINADEGEPGTFKDRFYLEGDPHRFLEGMLIGAWATEVSHCYIYLRDEYPAAYKILKKEMARLDKEGLIKGVTLDLRRGAGAYICGEESAMIESIEGKRGLPRHKPPYPSQVGLFGRPTLTNNVETVFWVRDIMEKGPEWFASQGKGDSKGLRSYSVSGRVKNPGVKLAPAGTTIRELIDDWCGGMEEGHSFKAYLPGGASGGILPASMDDLPLDFGTLEQHGCFIGSAAVVVLSDKDPIKDVVKNLMRFFEDESCGQCTPCRAGTEKLVKILDQDNWQDYPVDELCKVMQDASICGLGQAAPNPLLSLLRYFPEDL
ncbi:NAD(P)H-dependent oxidoreductase subunit E [Rhodovibrionaceae bacterium A322]